MSPSLITPSMTTVPPGATDSQAASTARGLPTATIGVLDAVAGDPPDLGGDVAVGPDHVAGAHRPGVLELVVGEVDGDDRVGAS